MEIGCENTILQDGDRDRCTGIKNQRKAELFYAIGDQFKHAQSNFRIATKAVVSLRISRARDRRKAKSRGTTMVRFPSGLSRNEAQGMRNALVVPYGGLAGP
jgi:hypothetical protein